MFIYEWQPSGVANHISRRHVHLNRRELRLTPLHAGYLKVVINSRDSPRPPPYLSHIVIHTSRKRASRSAEKLVMIFFVNLKRTLQIHKKKS